MDEQIEIPEMSSLLAAQLSDVESLNGLAEKYVAVESVIFVVDQFRRIRNIIDQLVPDENGQIDNYFSQVCLHFPSIAFAEILLKIKLPLKMEK